MLAVDALDSLGHSLGDSICMKSTEDKLDTAALRDRKPKVVIVNCSTITVSSNIIITWFIYGEQQTMRRATVLDECEQNKGEINFPATMRIS